jgi:hypothetical protein
MLMHLLADHLLRSHVFCREYLGDADQFRQESSPAACTVVFGDRPVDCEFSAHFTVTITDVSLADI